MVGKKATQNYCRCRIFPLPNSLLPIFPLAVFFRCLFSFPLLHTLKCFPTCFLPAYFSLPIFPVAQFFRLPFLPLQFIVAFFQLPFLPLPFCRESCYCYMQQSTERGRLPLKLSMLNLQSCLPKASLVSTNIVVWKF